MLATYDIARLTGVSPRTVQRRLKQIAPKEYRLEVGRPTALYSEEVLKLFPQFATMSPELPTAPVFDEPIKDMQVRKQRADRGSARIVSEGLEYRLKTEIFNRYIIQARADAVMNCTKQVISEMWDEIEAELNGKKTYEQFVKYFYNRRLMEQREGMLGYVHSEQWRLAWERQHKVNKFNAKGPTMRWEMLEYLTNCGEIGEGFGAGWIWVMDGTQFDSFVEIDGKAKTVNYLMIMDGVTGMPLFLGLLENGEKIADVAKLLWQCVNLHGVPKMGIVADNGSAFKSQEIRALVNSWYTPEELQAMKNNKTRNSIFPGVKKEMFGAMIYPLARIPRYAFKSKIERMFDSLHHHQTEMLAVSYIGSRDSRALSYELGSTPAKALKEAPKKEIAFGSYLTWIYTDFITRQNPEPLGYYSRKFKKSPTILNAFQSYGGKFELKQLDGRVEIQIQPSNPLPLASSALPYAIYAVCENKHKVEVRLGSAAVRHENRTYNFVSELLADRRIIGHKIEICVVGRQGYMFKKHDDRVHCELAPNKGDIVFLGIAEDCTIREIEDIAKRQIPRRVRKLVDENLKTEITISNQLIAGEFAEFKVIDDVVNGLEDKNTPPAPLERGDLREETLKETTPNPSKGGELGETLKSPKGTLREESSPLIPLRRGTEERDAAAVPESPTAEHEAISPAVQSCGAESQPGIDLLKISDLYRM